MVAPKAHRAGISAKASARFVWSVSSPIVLFITPSNVFVNTLVCIHREILNTNISVK